MSSNSIPVVFVHGLWLHTDSWRPWMARFAEHGFDPHNPGWPGDGDTVAESRAHPERVGGFGISEVVSHYAAYIRTLPAPPVVVGHSFGGLIVQRLLTEGHARAAVALDPAPIKGVLLLPPSSLRVASIALRRPSNRKGAVSLSAAQFRYGFANNLDEAETAELFERWTVPSPGRPLFEAATASLTRHSPAAADVRSSQRGPLLLVAGGKDNTVPARTVRTTHRLYRHSTAVTELIEFPDRGHSLGIDHGWTEIADAALGWLKEQRL